MDADVEAALEYMRGHQPNLRWADPGVYRAWPTIEAHITELEAEASRWVEREAACCPEDRGFDEVIAAQAQEIERLKTERLALLNQNWGE